MSDAGHEKKAEAEEGAHAKGGHEKAGVRTGINKVADTVIGGPFRGLWALMKGGYDRVAATLGTAKDAILSPFAETGRNLGKAAGFEIAPDAGLISATVGAVHGITKRARMLIAGVAAVLGVAATAPIDMAATFVDKVTDIPAAVIRGKKAKGHRAHAADDEVHGNENHDEAH